MGTIGDDKISRLQPREMRLGRYQFVYRCRRCGAVGIMDPAGVTEVPVYDINENAAPLVLPHVCDEGHAGVCDLIGATLVESTEAEP